MKQKQSKPAAYFDVPAMNTTAVAAQFKQFRTEVADAIREKKGTTDPIHPKDFGEEIKNLSGGSSDILYFYDGSTHACYCDTASGLSVSQTGVVITDNSDYGNSLFKNDNGEFDAFAHTYNGLTIGVVKNVCKSGEFKVKWLTADGSQYGDEYIEEVNFGTHEDNWIVSNYIYGGLSEGIVKAIVTYCGNEYIVNFAKK